MNEERLNERIERLQEELERMKALNVSLLRQCKEKSNQQKADIPKKEHSGYCLVSSNPKEIRYQYENKVYTADIFESVFQTPYSLDVNYYDAIELAGHDLWDELEDENLLSEIGYLNLECDSKYQDLFTEEAVSNRTAKRFNEYKRDHGVSMISEEVEERIRKEVRNDIDSTVFNFNARMNGRAGFWEIIFQTKYPLDAVPVSMRFKTKGGKKNVKER